MNRETDQKKFNPARDLPEAAIDTARPQADATLVEVDQWVRDAMGSGLGPPMNATASHLLAKLADPKTIRELSAESAARPKTAGPYELLEEIGRGGMGSVYRARHRQLGKIQALKVIHSNFGMTPEVRARFRREVQAIGALQHKNIIAAHDADFEGDVPYLVMDFISGESLSEVQKRLWVQGQRISIGAACEVVRQAAEGIQYAHEQRITHRDIKPGNLMLDRNGTVLVLDLGLARLGGESSEKETEETELTRGNQILGTPDYMSPEQIQSSRSVDARTDVYALGATLFTLIAGRTVFASKPGESFLSKASRILSEPVPDIRKLVPTVPKELAALVHRCLAKSPNDRLQTARELAEAIRPWCDSRAVMELIVNNEGETKNDASASGSSPTQTKRLKAKRSRPLSRHFIGLALAAVTLGLLLVGVVLTLRLPGGGELVVESNDPNAQITVVAVKDGQREDLSITREVENRLRLSEGRWTITIAGTQADQFQLSENEVLIGPEPARIRVLRRGEQPGGQPGEQMRAIPPSHTASQESEPAKSGSSMPPDIPQPVVHWAEVRSSNRAQGLLAISDPQARGEQASGEQWQIRPWLPELTQHAHYMTENRVALDPTGKYFAVISQFDCKVMEVATGSVIHTIPSPAHMFWGCVSLSADCHRIALLSSHGDYVEVRDERNRIVSQWSTKTWIDTDKNVGAIAWMHSGEQLIVWDRFRASVVGLDGVIQSAIVFDAETGPEHAHFDSRILLQRAVECHADNRRIALGCADGRVRVWDLDQGALQVLSTERGDEVIRAVHWSPDGKLLACIRAQQSYDGAALEMWTSGGILQTTLMATQLNAPSQYANEFAWSPDSRSLILGSGAMLDSLGNLQRQFELQAQADQGINAAISTVWIPCWANPDRIDFVATGETYSLQCGRVRSFTPTGRTLPSAPWRNILQPQEFSWIEETGELSVVFSQPHWSELRSWTQAGKPTSSVRIPSFVAGKIQPKNGNLLCIGSHQVQVLDRMGQTLGRHQFQENEQVALGQASWNQAGDRVAYVSKTAHEAVVHLLTSKGEKSATLHLPSSEFNEHSSYFFWSPDDRYLALSVLMNESRQQVHVWELNTDGLAPVVTLTMDDAHMPRIVWNPTSQWLIVAPGNNQLQSPTLLRLVHVPSRQTKEVPTQHIYYPAWHAPEWFNAKTVRVGGMALSMPQDPNGQITVNDLGFTLTHAVAAVNMLQPGEVLLAMTDQQGRSAFEIWKGGKLHSSISAPPLSGSGFSKNSKGSKVVFFCGRGQVAFVQVDLQAGAIDYVGAAFDNGSTTEISAGSDLAAVVASSDSYLGYTLCYPGGAEVSLTRTEYQRRQQADATTSALQWVWDVGGLQRLNLAHTPVESSVATTLLSATQLRSLNLAGTQVDRYLLSELAQLPNLTEVDLRHAPHISTDDLEQFVEANPRIRVIR